MPNWCYTNYRITRSKENGGVTDLYNKLQAWIKEGTTIKNSWDNEWLGLFVEKALGDDPIKGKYECRGCYGDIALSADGTEITFWTETAWSPMVSMWIDIVDKYCPDAQLYFTAEECGNELYMSNDPEMLNTWVIDSYGDYEMETMYDASIEDVRTVIRDLFPERKRIPKRSDLIEKFVDKNWEVFSDADLSIHRWDEVSLDDVA